MSRTAQNRFALVILTLLSIDAAHSGPSRDEGSAKYATYECAIPNSEGDMRSAATAQAQAVFDRNKLGCSADIWFSLASKKSSDLATQVAALRAQTVYIIEINTLWDLDFYGIRAPEWGARIKHAITHGDEISERLSKVAAPTSESQAAIALYELAWTFKVADTATSLKYSKAALQKLQSATAQKPDLFNGEALLALAKLQYELPEFGGGDPVKGVASITLAYKVAPTNPSVVRYYAFVQAQEGHRPLADSALSAMLTLRGEVDNSQQLADELLNARDLATRLGEADRAKQLNRKRDALLAAHRELLTRAHTAANLHGGVDPLTGKDY
jgi:hypothetical protein